MIHARLKSQIWLAEVKPAGLNAGVVFALGSNAYRRRARRENYGRLDAWQWAEYDRVVYLDADCMVVGNLEPMFRMPRGLVGTVGAPAAWAHRLTKTLPRDDRQASQLCKRCCASHRPSDKLLSGGASSTRAIC